MKKLSYTDIAVFFLHKRRGEWVVGHQLSKANLDGNWVGPSTERRLREASSLGYHIIKGVKYMIEEKLERGYIWYRCPVAEKEVTNVEITERDGRPVAVIKQLTIKIGDYPLTTGR